MFLINACLILCTYQLSADSALWNLFPSMVQDLWTGNNVSNLNEPTPISDKNDQPPPTDLKETGKLKDKVLKCDRKSQAVADWLNSINIGSFFDYSRQYVFHHNDCFVFFDAFENFSLWVEPYGFYSHYVSPLKGGEKMDFTLSSVGSGFGGKFSINDQINVGSGIGYFHSSLSENSVKINGLYFGPAFQYLYDEGSVGLTIFGIGNFYGDDSHSWDLDLRLEADYSIETPSDFFINDLTIHPFVRIDYLNVFVKSGNLSFFYSKLAARFERVMFCKQSGIITANFDLGWVNMTPISSSSQKCNVKPESKNQAALGFELVGMHKNGILAGLGYEAALGANSPMQTGRLRFEWNW